jgi:hypothetical protein
MPGWGLLTTGAGISLATYGQMVKRHGDEALAAKIAAAPALASGWLAAAAELGITGPLSLGYLGLFGVSYGAYRLDESTRRRVQWRRHRTEWHRNAGRWGLQGSHLLAQDDTRLGQRFIVDVTGTGQRASGISRSDLDERIAEHYGLPPTRVRVTPERIAGRIRISVRFRDPWAVPILHPLIDEDPELDLPAVSDVTKPQIIGMDPETGRPLTITFWDRSGTRNTLIVSMKGGGKTVLLNDILERLTAAYNATTWGIAVAKGKHLRPWKPALGLTACGPNERLKAVRMLELGCKIIDYREAMSSSPTLVPDALHPLVEFVVDEMSALLGPSDALGYRARRAAGYIASKDRAECVGLVVAGQRGTQSHVGDTDIRTQMDQYVIGKVSRRTEMAHVAGEVGLELPDMTRYGEGHGGVQLVATVDGHYSTGRTLLLEEFEDVERIAAEREPVPLEPGLIEYLGDDYRRLLDDGPDTVVLTSPAPSSPAPQGQTPSETWMNALDADLEAGMPDDLREKLQQAAANLDQACRDLAETPPLPEPTAEQAEKLRESAEDRRGQAAAQTEIPPAVRECLIELLSEPEGTTVRLAEAALKEAGLADGARMSTWRFLDRLRWEGVAVLEGKGRGSRWHLAPRGDAHAPTRGDAQ